MSEKNKNRQIAKISIFITSIFIIFMSITYAFITQVLTGEKQVIINAGVLELELEEENEITINDALPMYDEVGMIQNDVFKFRLINKTSNPTKYTLKLVKNATENELSTSDVKYYLTKEGIGEPKLLSSLPTDGKVDSGTIAGNDTLDYELRLWIDNSVVDNESLTGKSLSYKIYVDASQEIATLPSFVDKLEAKVDTTSTINFSQISGAALGRGIYKYKEDGKDIYYWRGNVDLTENSSNHVIFGGYCWEMIRTTKTGGIKIIYDGTPIETGGIQTCPNTGAASRLSSRSPFNANEGDNAHVGYMYGLTGISAELSAPQCIRLNSAGTNAEVSAESTKSACLTNGGKWVTTAYEATHANVVNSTIKTTIDNWFSASALNTKENLDKIEDTVYCNDRSLSKNSSNRGYGTKITDYAAYHRLVDNKTPSLECSQENDSFTVNKNNGNGDLTYPVGLLTADEMVLAGGLYDRANFDYYLYENQTYWNLSPAYYTVGSAFAFGMGGNGAFLDDFVSETDGIRPVISLIPGIDFPQGTGTENNPYIVE